MAFELDTRIFLAGHHGMVGSAIHRALTSRGYTQIITRTSKELDLRDQGATRRLFADEKPEVVVVAAAKVGGIWANSNFPADFIYDNLAIAVNMIQVAHEFKCRKLVNLGSSCIYPRMARQPIGEDQLLTSELEPTNRPYAVAKIAAIEMCDAYRRQYGDDFISLMPTNMYGPFDNYNLDTSHVIPALIRKFDDAARLGHESVTVWGTGKPLREFMYVDDMADACLFTMDRVAEAGPINVGTGQDLTIAELAGLVGETVGFTGRIEFDSSKPDGAPRKLLDVSRLRGLGWTAKTPLREGLKKTYAWYCEHQSSARGVA